VIDLVREFHVTYGQAIAEAPHVIDSALNALRVELLREELRELEVALAAGDVVSALDALTDLQYVLDGAYLALGFHSMKDAALVEVHRSNMSKLDDDGRPIYRADGKILKGPRYNRPNLAAILNEARAEAAIQELAECEGMDMRLRHALIGDVK
jgi:predicted HAD superfamily Cof-like phosphohydrolase